jgi:hypothetical protein
MDRSEVIKILTANVDKVVRLSFNDGAVQTAKVHLVDDEGVVYWLVESNRVRDEAACWTFFEDIEGVLPLGDSK